MALPLTFYPPIDHTFLIIDFKFRNHSAKSLLYFHTFLRQFCAFRAQLHTSFTSFTKIDNCAFTIWREWKNKKETQIMNVQSKNAYALNMWNRNVARQKKKKALDRPRRFCYMTLNNIKNLPNAEILGTILKVIFEYCKMAISME